MEFIFYRRSASTALPKSSKYAAYLQPNNWDDFGHKTLFTLTIFDAQGKALDIGSVKIGFCGQTKGWTDQSIPEDFHALPDNFFSLGQDADYYSNLINLLPKNLVELVLEALGDVAHSSDRLAAAQDESVFKNSLTRSVNRATIDHQFRRILRHEAPLTEYDFIYQRPLEEDGEKIELRFKVTPDSKPPSNIHILIGRNGAGKTTLLHNMATALVSQEQDARVGFFSVESGFFSSTRMPDDYFAGVVSVSFSAFDNFSPLSNGSIRKSGVRYTYIGLKTSRRNSNDDILGLKNRDELCSDFRESLRVCLSLSAKKERWVAAVKELESDKNFAEMDLCQLASAHTENRGESQALLSRASSIFNRMSSGHAIVLLTITKLVESVEEKTLVLMDEPESHLHPPLLSAFIRALSDLLVSRNGVAIVATHSPVVLQETPKSCVSIIRRNRLSVVVESPEIETFAENVGVLTREVFGLEVSKSGFHYLLAQAAEEGGSLEDIEKMFGNHLGFEGKAILRSIVFDRDQSWRDD